MLSFRAALLFLPLIGCVVSSPTQKRTELTPAPSKPSLAINLSGPVDWNTEMPFVDLFRFSRKWVSQKEGAAWGKGPQLAHDKHGWVMRLEKNAWAETFLTSFEKHYPKGDYVVLYEGEGRFGFPGNVTVRSERPGRIVVAVDPDRGFFSLQLKATNPANYVRNIRVLMPGSEATYRTQPFNPTFLKHWKGVSAFRFMDWMETNNSKVKSWADRPTMEDSTWAEKGVPLEMMIALCNTQNADGWFCMPHMADDQYMQNFALMVLNRLKTNLKAHVELSNEVWNGQFEQQRYAGNEGLKAKLSDKHWSAGWFWYARRSVQMFNIWSKQMPKNRLVRVLASQAGNAWVSGQILSFENAGKQADVLAIAPYMGMSVPAQGSLNSGMVSSWSLEELFTHMKKVILPETIGYITANKVEASKFGLPLVAYEGGQHLVGIMGGENNEAMTRLFMDANRDRRMGQLYETYLDAWAKNGGGLFAHFGSTGSWSKWGSWGDREYSDDEPSTSAKYTALQRWAKKFGQKLGE